MTGFPALDGGRAAPRNGGARFHLRTISGLRPFMARSTARYPRIMLFGQLSGTIPPPFECCALTSRGEHASDVLQNSMFWLWVSWREICVANAGEPVSMTAETANSVAIVLRRILMEAEATLVITEFPFGFTTIRGDRFCPLRWALSGQRSNG